jgi:hypothetical protein
MAQVEAQYHAAVRSGATDEALGERTIRGVTNPPNADPQRAAEVKSRFVQLKPERNFNE